MMCSFRNLYQMQISRVCNYIVGSRYDSLQRVLPPHVNISRQTPGVGDPIRSKGQGKKSLDFPGFPKHAFLGSQSIPTQSPKLDVFYSTTHNSVVFEPVELNIEDLHKQVLKRYLYTCIIFLQIVILLVHKQVKPNSYMKIYKYCQVQNF